MKLFLVTSKVYTTPYMGNTDKGREEIDLVQANDEDEAEKKVEQYYQDQGTSYCTSYRCDVQSVKGMIE